MGRRIRNRSREAIGLLLSHAHGPTWGGAALIRTCDEAPPAAQRNPRSWRRPAAGESGASSVGGLAFLGESLGFGSSVVREQGFDLSAQLHVIATCLVKKGSVLFRLVLEGCEKESLDLLWPTTCHRVPVQDERDSPAHETARGSPKRVLTLRDGLNCGCFDLGSLVPVLGVVVTILPHGFHGRVILPARRSHDGPRGAAGHGHQSHCYQADKKAFSHDGSPKTLMLSTAAPLSWTPQWNMRRTKLPGAEHLVISRSPEDPTGPPKLPYGSRSPTA